MALSRNGLWVLISAILLTLAIAFIASQLSKKKQVDEFISFFNHTIGANVSDEQQMTRWAPNSLICFFGDAPKEDFDRAVSFVDVLNSINAPFLKMTKKDNAADCPEETFIYYEITTDSIVERNSIIPKLFLDRYGLKRKPQNRNSQKAPEEIRPAFADVYRDESDPQNIRLHIGIAAGSRLKDEKTRAIFINDVIQEELFQMIVGGNDIEIFGQSDIAAVEKPIWKSEIIEYWPNPHVSMEEFDIEDYQKNNSINVCLYDLMLVAVIYTYAPETIESRKRQYIADIRNNFDQIHEDAERAYKMAKERGLIKQAC